MIRIALADDHKLFAKVIEGILEDEDDLVVVGVFPNVNQGLPVIKTNNG